MIHTSITVGITTGEYKALQYVMVDQKEWLENCIKNRARQATIDMTQKTVGPTTVNPLVDFKKPFEAIPRIIAKTKKI